MFSNSLDLIRNLALDNASLTKASLKLQYSEKNPIVLAVVLFLLRKKRVFKTFFFFFLKVKMCETFQSKAFSPKHVHFAGLFWLQIFYLIGSK